METYSMIRDKLVGGVAVLMALLLFAATSAGAIDEPTNPFEASAVAAENVADIADDLVNAKFEAVTVAEDNLASAIAARKAANAAVKSAKKTLTAAEVAETDLITDTDLVALKAAIDAAEADVEDELFAVEDADNKTEDARKAWVAAVNYEKNLPVDATEDQKTDASVEVGDRSDDYNTAKTTLSAAEQNLADAEAVLTDAETALADADAALDAAAQVVVDAAAALVDAESALVDAKKAVVDANAALVITQADLNAAVAAANIARTTADNARAKADAWVPPVVEPPVDEPVVDEPVVDEPVVDEPVVDEPVVDEPTELELFIESAEYNASTDADTLRLYRAFFNREPDVNGVKYWIRQARSGVVYDEIAWAFANSSEFQNTYGDVNADAFLVIVYGNVLGRTPDAPGLAYWTEQVAQGLAPHGVVRWVAAGDEFKTAYPYLPTNVN